MKCNTRKHETSPLSLTYGTLCDLTDKTKSFKEGDIVYLTDKQQMVCYKDNNWVEITDEVQVKGTSNIEMNTYDMNKQIISQLPILSDLTEAEKTISTFARNSFNNDFMLLCKELSYYTIFQKTEDAFTHFSTFGDAVLTCAQDIGNIISVDYMENTNTIEIWVRTKNNEDNVCMVLFDCKDFIVTYSYKGAV